MPTLSAVKLHGSSIGVVPPHPRRGTLDWTRGIGTGMDADRWKQIDLLYHAACDREPEMRAAFLAEACGGDEDLRRQVETLVKQEGSLLDHPAWESPMLKPGTRIGPYEIVAKLGEGGMGVVYRATDTRLNRPVAIKLLSEEIASNSTRRRFQQEAKTLSSLSHPHILTVYEAGEFEGRQYLVTEFADGGTLREWAAAAKRPWPEILNLLLGVADGLACAHEAQILHRDIKPHNVLVTRNGYAKLADFGLAKLLESPRPDDATRSMTEHRTGAGVVMGTVAYMSPEQAAGRPVDARSDIFSFSVLLYELLEGRRPFAASTDLDVMHRIVHGVPDPLTANIPAGFRAIVEKALEKAPADRYQSMREMVVDLRRLTRSGTQNSLADAPPPSAASVAGTAKRWKIPAASAVGLLLVLAAGYFYFRRTPALTDKDTIVLADFKNTTEDAVFDATLRQGLSVQLEQSPF